MSSPDFQGYSIWVSQLSRLRGKIVLKTGTIVKQTLFGGFLKWKRVWQSRLAGDFPGFLHSKPSLSGMTVFF